VIAFLSFSVLLYEIALTRLFSYLLPYHFTQLAVSLALLGVGLGAWARAARGPLNRTVAWLLLAGSYPLFLGIACVTSGLGLLVAASWPPFFLAGLLLADAYAAARGPAYALDLAGGALACLAAPAALGAIGAPGLLLLLAAVSAARLFTDRRMAGAALALCVGLAIPLERELSAALPRAPLMRFKTLGTFLRSGGSVHASAWSALGRSDVFGRADAPFVRWIFNDGISPTLIAAAEFPDREKTLRELLNYAPYEVFAPKSALILGSGSGLEVLLAGQAGASRTTAVEINPAILKLARGLSPFAGDVYGRPGVELRVEDGRRFLESSRDRYDLIQMSFVLTGNQQPASFALVEAPLYTVEAFRLYLDHLSPGGALALIDESRERVLRQFLTALAALRERGVETQEGLSRLAVLAIKKPDEEFRKFLLVLSPEPLSKDALARLEAISKRPGYEAHWLPGHGGLSPFDAIASLGPESFIRAYPLDLTPCRDDSPQFFSYAKTVRQKLVLASPWLLILALSLGAGALARRGLYGGGLAFKSGTAFLFAELALLRGLSIEAGGPVRTLAALLFSLLAWGAAGAWLGARKNIPLPARFLLCAAAVPLSWVLSRAAGVWIGLIPVGLALGLPFAGILKIFPESAAPRLLALAGLGSVFGGALSLSLVLLAGTRAQIGLASGLYSLVALAAALSQPKSLTSGN
jgi:hypothetical protein